MDFLGSTLKNGHKLEHKLIRTYVSLHAEMDVFESTHPNQDISALEKSWTADGHDTSALQNFSYVVNPSL